MGSNVLCCCCVFRDDAGPFFPAVLVCQHQLLYCGVLCFFLETLISFQPDLGPRVTKSSKDILLFLQRATISSF
jgi:hypothetical protein